MASSRASFPDSLWAEIRKEFGEHCMRRSDYQTANDNFKESLQRQPDKLESVYRLTNSQAREANVEIALQLLSEKADSGESTAKKSSLCEIGKSQQIPFCSRRQIQASLQL